MHKEVDMNLEEILNATIPRILNPETFNMDYWMETPQKLISNIEDMPAEVGCGTTACLAGWMVIVAREHGMEFRKESIEGAALDLIGWAGDRLFSVVGWDGDIQSSVDRGELNEPEGAVISLARYARDKLNLSLNVPEDLRVYL